MSWSNRFDAPIALPGGGEVETLREAGEYIAGLPKREHDQEHWQTATRVLAELGGIVMMADIAMRRWAICDGPLGASFHGTLGFCVQGLTTPAATSVYGPAKQVT
jgi:hypothetical protein